jgi:uncharacterized protein YjeT (DUF2065 family)
MIYKMLTSFPALAAVTNPMPVNQNSIRLFGLIITTIGVVSLIRPQFFWHLRVGRKLPGVPPNKLYLNVLRFGAVLVIAIGLLMIFVINTVGTG